MATEYFNDAWRIPNNKNQSLVSNYSMDFDGTNSNKIDLGTSINLAGKYFTISGWYNIPSITGFISLFSQGTSKNIGIFINNSYLHFFFKTTSWSGTAMTTTLATNVWQHIACVYDGSNQIIYINGVAVKTQARTGDVTYDNTPTYLGVLGTTGYTGKMDQVSIFDYALPATGTNSVATLYGGGTAVTNPMSLSPAPVAYYQLGDQSVSTGPSADYLVPNNSLQDYVFNFDGSSQNINIDNEITLSNSKSISFWLNFDTIPTQAAAGPVPLSSSTNNYYPMIAVSSGNIRLYIKGTNGFINAVTNTTVTANTWYHIVITGDGTNSYWYINGGIDSGGFTGDRTGVSIKSIGSRLNGSSRSLYVDGQMSNVAIWDSTTLTSAQVTTIYNNGSPNDISSLNPTAWYKLNAQDTFDGTNWTIKDSAGSNDGTSSGMTSANLVQSNLQHTSGYSPYALSFDGTSDRLVISKDLTSLSAITISVWANKNSLNATNDALFGIRRTVGGVPQANGLQVWRYPSGNLTFIDMDGGSSSLSFAPINDVWFHLVITYDVTNIKAYVNGNLSLTTTSTKSLALSGAANNIYIGAGASSGNNWVGDISNFSLFNTAINQAQVTTLYNQGVPSNLNNFTPKPIAWWQIGSNSSFNTNWTCLDEIGTNNAVSVNMTNDDITNGVGYSANGLGTSSIEIVGDAPYSTANGLSENMDVLDRTTDVPPTV